MDYASKRSEAGGAEGLQAKNREWWTSHTMSYDWKDKSEFERFSSSWFDDIDRRFLSAARLFSAETEPFAELMNLRNLRGRRVLEIGCGMGYHTELLARAGADVTAIDLSPTSVSATTQRLAVKQLRADVREMDAEALQFPAESFDLIWSWGVIHHSARTGRIVREIARVIRPRGEARIMVYNLGGMPAYATIVRQYLLGFWRGRSLDELLWRSTDGYSARFYTRDLLADLLGTFFDRVEINVLGQESDAAPLPRLLRRPVIKLIPIQRQRSLVRRRGAFLFAVASKE